MSGETWKLGELARASSELRHAENRLVQLRARRDRLLRENRADGWKLRVLAEECGLTTQMVSLIVRDRG